MQTLKKKSPLMRGEDVTMYQQLVTAAGYGCGAIDGLYGDKCVEACKAFQRARGLAVDGICGPKTWAALQPPMEEPGTAHFKMREFRCKDGTDVPRDYWSNLQRAMDRLEVLRSELGNRPITIVSGYRTPAYNKRCGGAKNSQHMYATAADIRVSGLTPSQVYKVANEVYADGGLGKYDTFTHVDVRGKRARW